MSFSNIGSNITTILLLNISHNGTQTDCTTYGFFAIFFYLSGAFWSIIIANTLSLVLIRRNDLLDLCSQVESQQDIKLKCSIKFHSSVWGISFICAFIPAISGYFQITQNNWCWYNGNVNNSQNMLYNPNDRMEVLTYLLPISLSVLYCLCILLAVLYNMKYITNSALNMRDPLNIELYELIRVLKYYPVVS